MELCLSPEISTAAPMKFFPDCEGCFPDLLNLHFRVHLNSVLQVHFIWSNLTIFKILRLIIKNTLKLDFLMLILVFCLLLIVFLFFHNSLMMIVRCLPVQVGCSFVSR